MVYIKDLVILMHFLKADGTLVLTVNRQIQ